MRPTMLPSNILFYLKRLKIDKNFQMKESPLPNPSVIWFLRDLKRMERLRSDRGNQSKLFKKKSLDC